MPCKRSDGKFSHSPGDVSGAKKMAEAFLGFGQRLAGDESFFAGRAWSGSASPARRDTAFLCNLLESRIHPSGLPISLFFCARGTKRARNKFAKIVDPESGERARAASKFLLLRDRNEHQRESRAPESLRFLVDRGIIFRRKTL